MPFFSNPKNFLNYWALLDVAFFLGPGVRKKNTVFHLFSRGSAHTVSVRAQCTAKQWGEPWEMLTTSKQASKQVSKQTNKHAQLLFQKIQAQLPAPTSHGSQSPASVDLASLASKGTYSATHTCSPPAPIIKQIRQYLGALCTLYQNGLNYPQKTVIKQSIYQGSDGLKHLEIPRTVRPPLSGSFNHCLTFVGKAYAGYFLGF